MKYTIIKQLPPVEAFIQAIPLSPEGYQQVKRDRQTVKNILRGKDPRLLVIVGPCSAWPHEAVLEYALRLKALESQTCHAIKLIMRVYIQKPRTTKGWTGPVNQPDPFLPPDIVAGIKYTRRLMVQIVELGLPIADEALFTHNAKGFLELLSWVAIGARSTEDQEHRIFASAIDCPVGMKNPTHGALTVAVNSIIAAQHAHVAAFDGYEVQTYGNPFAHLVLRGNQQGPNYSLHHLQEAQACISQQQIKHPAIIVDASHDNCLVNGKKDHNQQPNVIFNILDSIESDATLKPLIKGFMVESFLKGGHQKVDEKNPAALDYNGLSITDPCLDWESTKNMLLELSKRIATCK